MSNALRTFSDDLAAVVERMAPAVVAIHGRHRFASSGVVWRPGVIVTAEHTLKREDEIAVTLPDGTRATATLAGRDPGTDLAAIRCEAAVTPAPTGGAAVKPGHLILAVGRSADSGVTATLGVVSAVGEAWRTWRGGRLDSYLRLDVASYPGSSGAAVVDVAGAVVGIATSALSRIAPLAIPSPTIDRVADELLAKGHVSRGYLGIGLQPVVLPAHRIQGLDMVVASRGVIVLKVEPGGPAERSGLLIGDVIVALNGAPVADTDDVQAALGGESVGQPMEAVIVRGGGIQRVQVTAGERPRKEQ